MRYFYQTLPDFAFPEETTQPALGTIVPYLRPEDESAPGTYVGNAVTGTPLDIVFVPKWPALVPELRIGESLTVAKLGLPAVRGQTSVELIYQQSAANDSTADTPIANRLGSARLFDPTRAKVFKLEGNSSKSALNRIPGSVKTSDYIGKTYFPNLPPHLSQRLFFDPAVGKHGSLVFVGEFKDELFGEKYLLLNMMSAADIVAAKALCDVSDEDKALWDAAIDGLSTTMETFKEDPAKRGTYIVDITKNVDIGEDELAEVKNDDTAVDSYAISATGGGAGYVVMVAGNGRAFTPVGEPVSFHIFRVTKPLYRGELKVIASANPLDEKLTLQHSADFAGKPEEYEFEWRYAPPVEGQAPGLYSFNRALLVGDSDGSSANQWQLYRNPGANFTQLRGMSDETSSRANGTVNLPVQQVVINDGNGSAANGRSIPNVVLRRAFEVANRPLSLYLSLALQPRDGAVVYVNGARLAAHNVPGQQSSFTAGTPGPDYSPLPLLYEVPAEVIQQGANVITLELYTSADAGYASTVNARLEGALEVENIAAWIALPVGQDEELGDTPGAAKGKVRHIVEGSNIRTLSDNYYIMRYRALNSSNAAFQSNGGWSKWVSPQLAEGWIKRALAGISPFRQRITDLFNNPVDTDVSLVMQAGQRWEGDIALNLQISTISG
jgi:hypothetical protein